MFSFQTSHVANIRITYPSICHFAQRYNKLSINLTSLSIFKVSTNESKPFCKVLQPLACFILLLYSPVTNKTGDDVVR